jgi:hypothetical protein
MTDIETVAWYHEALTQTEAEALWDYMLECDAELRDWKDQFKADLQEGHSELIDDDGFDTLLNLRMRLGARIFDDTPTFEPGDGAHILYKGETTPVTVRRVIGREVTVSTDQVWLRPVPQGRQALFEPRALPLPEHLKTFTLRKDGTYQLLGTRRRSTFLHLGRSYTKKGRERAST